MIEKEAWTLHGMIGILIIGLLTICTLLSFLHYHFIVGTLLLILTVIFLTSFTFIHPNEAKVITFYHSYIGTIRKHGLVFTAPLTQKRTISLRSETLQLKDIHVTNMNGLSWTMQLFLQYKVVDTAKALYEVERYKFFMKEQSIAALKILMTKHTGEEHRDMTKEQFDELMHHLKTEIEARVKKVGIEVLEANVTNIMNDPPTNEKE